VDSAAIADEVRRHAHGRVPRELRERQLLAVAEDLFAEAGYAGASMDELARRAGVSKPVVYDLLGSKEEVFRRCVARQAGELAGAVAAAVDDSDDPAARVRAGILAFFTFVRSHRRLWEALTADVSPFAAEAADLRRRQARLVATLLADSAAQLGVDIAAIRVDATAHLLNGAMEGLARWWGSHAEVSAEELTSWAMSVVLPGLQEAVAGAQRDLQ